MLEEMVLFCVFSPFNYHLVGVSLFHEKILIQAEQEKIHFQKINEDYFILPCLFVIKLDRVALLVTDPPSANLLGII